MGVFKTLSIYKSLSAEQKDMVKLKHVSAKHNVADWLDLMKQPAYMDRMRDKYVARSGWWIFWACCFFVILLVIGVTKADQYEYMHDNLVVANLLRYLLPAIGLGWLVFTIITYRKLSSIDLGNHLRLFVVPLFAALKEELKKKQTIELDLNASAALTKENLKSETKPEGKSYPRITTSLYEVPWMYGKTKLLDETLLEWNITDLVRHRTVVKQNPRGKIKTKEKFKIKHKISAKITFAKSQYKISLRPTKDMDFKETDTSYIFKIKGGAVSRAIDDSLPLNVFLDTISKTYSRVEPLS